MRWISAHLKVRITQGFCVLSVSKLLWTIIRWLALERFSWLYSLRYTVIHTLLSTIRRNLEHCVCVCVTSCKQRRAHTGLLCSVSQMVVFFSTVTVHGERIEHWSKKGIVFISNKTAETHNFKHADTMSSTHRNPPHSSRIFVTHFLHPPFSWVHLQCIKLSTLLWLNFK